MFIDINAFTYRLKRIQFKSCPEVRSSKEKHKYICTCIYMYTQPYEGMSANHMINTQWTADSSAFTQCLYTNKHTYVCVFIQNCIYTRTNNMDIWLLYIPTYTQSCSACYSHSHNQLEQLLKLLISEMVYQVRSAGGTAVEKGFVHAYSF